ncbi:MAG: hypothetical protein MI749_16115, partial [Desulfovibrionales bacterium]|nr:hypothetical protein [Desulfovibrionales bacterium]
KRNLVQGTTSKGLLARGTVTFSKSSGKIVDFTMSEMTGRLGNFTANGINTTKDVDYQIVDYEAVQLDGYGFELEFDGTSWSFADTNGDGIISATDLPDNYPNAKIVKSDGQNIDIVLDPANNLDVDPDLRIKLAQPAVATDSIGFDINKETDLHEQGISGTTYTNDTANDNTMLHINEPGVMNLDADDLGIAWNPQTETWHWINPVDANSAGTLVTNIQTNDTANISTTSMTVGNPADVDMVLDGMKLRYNDRLNGGAGAWDWNQDLKTEDFSNPQFSFTPTNDPVLSIVSAGSQGAVASVNSTGAATSLSLTWNATSGTWTGTMSGNTQMSIAATNSPSSQVQFQIWAGVGMSAGASVVRYTFGNNLSTASNGTIQFSLDPTPPQEYKNAMVTTSGAGTNGFSLNLDGDTDTLADLSFNVTAGGGAVGVGDTLSFNLDPDTPPVEYADATLKGDKTRAVIDLDGSGNEDDKEDIVFDFKNDLTAGTSAHPFDDKSTISFDIKGSTVWREISKDEIRDKGYFSFTTDFLGGDFGSTETAIQLDIGTKYDGSNFVNDSLTTTQFSKSSATVFQDADGYAAGDLQTVTVAADGVMTGVYSNGQLIPLFRVGLAKFQNNYGLSNTGG